LTFAWKFAIVEMHADSPRLWSDTLPRILRFAGLVSGALGACLYFAPGKVASAGEPNQAGKRALQNARQDDAATEKTQRDAVGLLTVEGTVLNESGNPAPNSRVRLQTGPDRIATSLSDAQGHFRFLSLDLPSCGTYALTADHPKDGRKGYFKDLVDWTLGLPAPAMLVLKPPRELVIAVKDQQGVAVAGALVEVSASFYSVGEGRTGSNGTLQLKLPADAEFGTVIAHKSGAGFDYWTNRVGQSVGPEPLPPKLSLTLNGARTVRVHATDSSGRPIAGVPVIPSKIYKQGQSNCADLSYFSSQLERTQTDSNGIATIDWIPVDLSGSVWFMMNSRDFHLPNPPRLHANPKQAVVDLDMQLLRTTTISGIVYAADGKPAPGVVVLAEGKVDFRDAMRTNADGEFEFHAYPEQSYLVAVLDENWAAASCPVARLPEDEPVSSLEFRLTRGTVVRGTVTAADGRPQADWPVWLTETAQLPAPAKSPDLARWAKTDSQGHYHFRVGPGTYEIVVADQMPRGPLRIGSEREVVQDFRADQ